MRKSVFPPASSANSPGQPAQDTGTLPAQLATHQRHRMRPLMRPGSSPNGRAASSRAMLHLMRQALRRQNMRETLAGLATPEDTHPLPESASCRKVFCWLLRIFSRQNGSHWRRHRRSRGLSAFLFALVVGPHAMSWCHSSLTAMQSCWRDPPQSCTKFPPWILCRTWPSSPSSAFRILVSSPASGRNSRQFWADRTHLPGRPPSLVGVSWLHTVATLIVRTKTRGHPRRHAR